jgi:hypothetical protein
VDAKPPESRPGSLPYAKKVKPGDPFAFKSPGNGGVGLCLAVDEWIDLSAFPHEPRRRVLVLWTSPFRIMWIPLP